MEALPFVDAAALARTLSWGQAVDALADALTSGLNVAAATARSRVHTAAGELLLMPAESSGAVGVKLVASPPGTPISGCPGSVRSTCCSTPPRWFLGC